MLFPAFKFSNTTDLDASVMVSAIFPFSAIVYFAIGLLFVIVVFNVIFFTVIFPLLTLISKFTVDGTFISPAVYFIAQYPGNS